MKVLKGIAASKGYAIGNVIYMKNEVKTIECSFALDTAEELKRFESAREKAGEALQRLYEKALEKVGASEAEIFSVHKLLIEDEDFISGITGKIEEDKVNASFAVQETGFEFEGFFRAMENEYFRERAADIKDISNRLIRILEGCDEDQKIENTGILFALDLTPSETIHIDKEKILAFVTKEGSAVSHSAILARTIGIPAVTGVTGLLDTQGERVVIVDGFKGKVYLSPDEKTLSEYTAKKMEYEKEQAELLKMRGKPSITKDGVHIELCCNIGGLNDVDLVIENDGEGIGLFRSEFLYMRGDDFPTEEEQFEAYKAVLEKMSPKQVVIRTLDLGADKHVPYFNLEKEENPAMGYRAIRICLTREDIFRTQIRALLRASVYGNLAIMFPMIITVEEFKKAREFTDKVREELKAECISVSDNVQIGIMVETPAAAMATDLLAKEADFFSIGTNDLTQYTLAVDRMNANVAKLYDARNISVLRFIKMTADNAHANGKWVGICGESASDEVLLKFYLAAGIDELSVTPKAVLSLRKAVQEINVNEICEEELKKWI